MASLWRASSSPPSLISLAPPARNPNSAGSPAWAARRRRRDFGARMRWSRADEGEEEERQNRHPLDIPLEYERPKPPSRPNVYPNFPKMETPLVDWLPYDEPPDDEVDEDEMEEEQPQQPNE